MKKSEKRKLYREKKQAKDGKPPDENLNIDGYITVYETSADFDKVINGENVHFSIWGCKDKRDLEDKLPLLRQAVQKYAELNAKAKNAIVEYFNNKEDGALIGFFHDIFGYLEYRGKNEHSKTFGTNDFDKVDIEKVVEYMDCDDLTIYCKNGIDLWLSYQAPGVPFDSEMHLLVTMNKYFMVTGFTPILD